MFSIDGLQFDMPCAISRKAVVESSNVSGTLIDGTYFSDVTATRLEYTITVAVPVGKEYDYAALYEALVSPVPEHSITVPYNQTDITFKARIESVSDSFYREENGTKIWRGTKFTCKGTEPYKVAE